MTKDRPKNVAASVRARLQALARDRGDDFQLILTRYGTERLLTRLAASADCENFILKGAVLFQLWTDQPYRATRDLDLLGRGENSLARMTTIFRDLCELLVPDDGLRLNSASVTAEAIRADQEYEGVRVRLDAKLESARIPLQIDIGFGDAVTPAPELVQFPSLLGFPTPILAAYPRETVIAEKLQAMVVLGLANSRMKDFFDLWILSERFEFHGERVRRALAATFARRNTTFPTEPPTAFTVAFATDDAKRRQWRAFIAKGVASGAPDLGEVSRRLTEFLLPPLLSCARGEKFEGLWKPPGPWLLTASS